MSYRVHVDFETRSTIDLRTRGSTIYAQHYTTSPLMLSCISAREELYDFFAEPGYASTQYPQMDEQDILLHAIHPTIPEPILKAIEDGAVFVAHNARFEQDIWYWICHKRWGWPMPKKWSCTAARSAYWGIRRSLEGAGSDLELDLQKSAEEGKEFIQTFCIPRKYKGPKKNGIITQWWAEPSERPEGWELGKRYCLQDARAEMAIDAMLPDLPEFEQRVWELDFAINTHGIPIDTDSVGKAIHFSDHYTQHAVGRFNAITSLNPTQRDRVLEYLNKREEMEKLPNLRTKTLTRINQIDLPEDLRDIINIRLDAARASVKKLQSMEANTSSDGYARGTFVYYGAHTGRFSAKRVQPHNFIRGDSKVADLTFRFLSGNSWGAGIGDSGMPVWVESADMLFPRPLKALSHSMRGFIKAPEGKVILSGDYSQIEARVLAWLACCESLLASYAAGEDVYVRFAADHMYRRNYADYFGPNGKILPIYADERQRAKSAVLGCGFQLGPDGFLEYCDNMDIILRPDEAEFTIKAYRGAYPEISDYNTGLWSRVNYCAIQAVENEGTTVQLWGTQVTFHVHRIDHQRWWLLCTLPSGRHIAYYRPKTDTVNQWGKPVLSFRTEWMGKSYREQTYGGRITENIVQGIARDIMCVGAMNAQAKGFNVFMLVHDEIVALILAGRIEEAMVLLKQCLLNLPACYDGLPLDADIKAMPRYTK
jgi:DNA polymerase